jgi:hypothetical protein
MNKSVVSRMSLRSDKDVETYLLKSRSDDNEKMSCYRQLIRVNQMRFLMKGKKIFFLLNIPASSVQGKSRSISV